MESTLGRIEKISVHGSSCMIRNGILAGQKGKVVGEVFSVVDRGGEQRHLALTIQTPIARVTLSPKDIELEGSYDGA